MYVRGVQEAMDRKIMLRLWVFISLLMTAATAYASDFVGLVQSCEKCHGKDGISTDPDVPIIAGFSYEGFLNTMEVFREGYRIALRYQKPNEPETVMNEIAKGLSDEEVSSLAEYYSQRDFIPARQDVNSDLAERGEVIHKKSCEKCHSDNGAHPVEDAAILAGQWTPYLRRQFDNFLSGKRWVPVTMLRRVGKLSEEDIEALLNFYSSKGIQER